MKIRNTIVKNRRLIESLETVRSIPLSRVTQKQCTFLSCLYSRYSLYGAVEFILPMSLYGVAEFILPMFPVRSCGVCSLGHFVGAQE